MLFVTGFSDISFGKLDNGNLVGALSTISSAIRARILDMVSSFGSSLYLTLASATRSLSIASCSSKKKAICFLCDSGMFSRAIDLSALSNLEVKYSWNKGFGLRSFSSPPFAPKTLPPFFNGCPY